MSSRPRSRITPEQRAEIVRRRRAGQTQAQVAAAMGVSAGSVSAITRAARGGSARGGSARGGSPKPPRAAATLPADASGAPTADAPSLDDLRALLAQSSRALAAAAAQAEAEGDRSDLLSAVRALSPMLIQLARLTPPPAEESGLMLVDAGEMDNAKREVRAKLHAMLAQAAEAYRGPRCETCGQHVTTTTPTQETTP